MIVGILGAGQLARMIALAGLPMGLNFCFYDSADECCAEPLGKLFRGSFDDEDLLKQFADEVDLITYEFENVPLKTIDLLPKDKVVYPSVKALNYTQDRLKEKNLFKKLGLPTPGFKEINNFDDLQNAKDELGFPFVIKTRSGGYDGKGQIVIKQESDFEKAQELYETVPCIAEEWVKFEREVSLITVCGKDDIRFYDLNENEHRNGVLYLTQNKKNDPIQDQAIQWAKKLSEKLNYRGILTIEFFQCGNTLLANEYAPRVHNSGHWTIEGATSSQFENHLRAILDKPLGSTKSNGYSKMYNCLGSLPNKESLLSIEDLHVHDYDKTPREGRKVGHINITNSSLDSVKKSESEFLNLV